MDKIMTVSYEIILDFYGDRRANRSGLPLMNHIDEGLEILYLRNASQTTKDAFCLHPFLQHDLDLTSNWRDDRLKFVDPEVIILAMEYRSVANDYLGKGVSKSGKDIRLSPINEVNEMLVADKIQNRKDYERYVRLGLLSEEKDRLDRYFRQWFDVLNIRDAYYESVVEALGD